MSGIEIKGGCQIKTAHVTGCQGVVGSLGACIRCEDGSYKLLSAAHVLTQHDPDKIGGTIWARESGDYDWNNTGLTVENHVPVTLYNDSSQNDPTTSKYDLAWADVPLHYLVDEAVSVSCEIERIGVPRGARDPVSDDTFMFYGGASQYLQETYLHKLDPNESLSTKLTNKVKIHGYHGTYDRYVFYEDVVRIYVSMIIVYPGDSGSAIIAQVDEHIVGIFIGASCPVGAHYNYKYGYFCKLPQSMHF